MDQSFAMGGLIPLWILGAPLLGALISLTTMPKPRRDTRDAPRDTRAVHTPHNPQLSPGLSAART